MPRKACLVPLILLVLAALAPAPAGAADDPAEMRLEQAREESGVERHPPAAYTLPAGELRLSAAELLATVQERLTFTVTLDRPVADGRLQLTVPARWDAVSAVSDLPFADVPGGDRTLDLVFRDASAGERRSVSVRDVGLPPGTYAVRYRWIEGGSVTAEGTARVILFAPAREAAEEERAPNPWARLADPGVEKNVTDDLLEESETFITIVPGMRRRFVVGANSSTGFNAWVTGDGGQTFTALAMPTPIDAPGESSPEAGDLCCDPMSAADPAGNLWYGGLSFDNGPGNPSRIVVNRIAAGSTAFQPQTVGLPVRTSGTQDKPMMTIDNSPASPRFGRLYVVWNEPDSGGGINVVIAQCDTRPGGVADPAHCDNADNWSSPVSVTPGPGGYIYADVAAAPDGTVYVTWWDYSSVNAIRGATCSAPTGCASAAAWSSPSTIATLDASGVTPTPLPFACPILAQPGGRASTAPNVEVDRSGGSNDGRVYVTWSDLRAGSGTTRCDDTLPPAATHLTFDSLVASAPGRLPSPADAPTRLLADGEGGGGANSDDWFPWLAVDQTTGQAWADFYSTRDDVDRKTTNFYARAVTPSSGGHALGPLTKVSGAASDYSGTTPCCGFQNDYGDYTGIDAAQGIAIPVWSDKRGGLDGEAFAFADVTETVPPETTITSGPADNAVTGPRPSFGFTADEPFSTFECQVDEGAYAACASRFTTPALTSATHVFRVRAVDPHGNTDGSPATRTFTADATAPDTTITSGPAEGSRGNDTGPAFGLSSDDAGATFECRVDGAAFAACETPARVTGLGEGTHAFQARAVDPVGNADASPASRSFTVDLTGPDTSITAGPAEGATIRTSAPRFAFAASEADVTFQCQVDGGIFAPCPTPVTVPSLVDGRHTVAARALDVARNPDPTPATRSFRILHPVAFSSRSTRAVTVTRRRGATLGQPRVTCPRGAPRCTLEVTATAVLRGRRPTGIGDSRRAIAAGKSARARFTLTARAFAVLERRGRLRAQVRLTGIHGSLSTVVNRAVTLLAP